MPIALSARSTQLNCNQTDIASVDLGRPKNKWAGKRSLFSGPFVSNNSLQDHPRRRLVRHQPRPPTTAHVSRTQLGSGTGVNVSWIDCDEPPPGPATIIANDDGADA